MSSGVTPARVLLIEDDLPLATIISKHLTARGHEARVAGSAEEADRDDPRRLPADDRAARHQPARRLRLGLPSHRAASTRPGTPPVFVVSATAVPPSRLREFDCAGYLPKPFAVPTLIEIVERHHSEADGAEASAPQGGLDAF